MHRSLLALLLAVLAATPVRAADSPPLSAAAADAGPALASAGGPLVVAIDPGHGGPPPHDGAHGPKKAVEKTIALAVSMRLKALLEARGATVILTREEDIDLPLADRAKVANESAADLFLSIHCNSMATPEGRKTTRGVETYFLSPDSTDAESKLLAEMENGGPDAAPVAAAADPVSGLLADLALGQARTDSARLAAVVHHHLVHGLRAPSRGVRQAPFLVLAGVKMPAVLVEVGFISHPREGRLLAKEDYQQRVALALADAVAEFEGKILTGRILSTALPTRRRAPPAPLGTGPSAAALATAAPSAPAASPLADATRATPATPPPPTIPTAGSSIAPVPSPK